MKAEEELEEEKGMKKMRFRWRERNTGIMRRQRNEKKLKEMEE